MKMAIRSYGDRALLIDLETAGDVDRLSAALASRPPAILDVIPAEATVLVAFDPRSISGRATLAWVESSAAESSASTVARRPIAAEIVIPVVYDGVDLASAAEAVELPVDDLIAAHTGARWRVAFVGFAPGFGYLRSDGWDRPVPRHPVPRTRVPAGAVALAGPYSAVYPRSSAGGWQLIGRTEAPLWDSSRSQPALLTPGTPVRFEAIG